jgi:hypothetical protein
LRAQVYDGVCAKEGMTFGPGTTAREASVAVMIIAAPILLARANISIGANVSIASSRFFSRLPPRRRHTSVSPRQVRMRTMFQASTDLAIAFFWLSSFPISGFSSTCWCGAFKSWLVGQSTRAEPYRRRLLQIPDSYSR